MVWETLEGLSPNIPLFQPSSKQVKATPGWVSQLRCSSRWPHKSQWLANISLSATLHGRRWVRCYDPPWQLLIPRCKPKEQHRLEHLLSSRGKESCLKDMMPVQISVRCNPCLVSSRSTEQVTWPSLTLMRKGSFSSNRKSPQVALGKGGCMIFL